MTKTNVAKHHVETIILIDGPALLFWFCPPMCNFWKLNLYFKKLLTHYFMVFYMPWLKSVEKVYMNMLLKLVKPPSALFKLLLLLCWGYFRYRNANVRMQPIMVTIARIKPIQIYKNIYAKVIMSYEYAIHRTISLFIIAVLNKFLFSI